MEEASSRKGIWRKQLLSFDPAFIFSTFEGTGIPTRELYTLLEYWRAPLEREIADAESYRSLT